jgi:NAD(P)-dependent dehydrogenase (short-subunit alcohol dehydrogenase family)
MISDSSISPVEVTPSRHLQQTMLRFDNKMILITGLGQTDAESEVLGIGAAIAVSFARQGGKIFGGNRSLESATVTKKMIEKEGGICDVMETDVTSSESVKALVDACMKKHGRIDVLVNNVGRSEPGCPATMSEEVWDSQVELNLKSVYLLCHHVLPIMEAQSCGAVVSIASVAGLRYIGKPQVAYSATKAAIMQFIKATAVIYSERDVRLNTVVPGLMDTPYTKSMVDRYAKDGKSEKFMEMRNQQVPMAKMGDAWDVANAAVFLCSDEAKYITGQSLVVDGGITSSTGRPPKL